MLSGCQYHYDFDMEGHKEEEDHKDCFGVCKHRLKHTPKVKEGEVYTDWHY